MPSGSWWIWRSGEKSWGRVLDAGCGTGENAIYLAQRGLEVLGIDGSTTAIERARAKAIARAVRVGFMVADALDLGALGESFDTAVDCGLFHVFDDGSRALYVESLAGVVRPGGRFFMMCFSEHEPGGWGPRRVRQAEIRAAFATGWVVDAISPAIFETNLEGGAISAWLASMTRT